MSLTVRGNVRVAAARECGEQRDAHRVPRRRGGRHVHDGPGPVRRGNRGADLQEPSDRVLEGFGLGAMLAMFMRAGDGIYTKAANVGADLDGKVEQNVPEDDPAQRGDDRRQRRRQRG
jgi:K(+)-stimulated pyrophosphate-energized sodium pump